MTTGQKQELFATLVADLIQWCKAEGYGVRVQEWRRTLDQQKLYFMGLNVGDDGHTIKGRKLSKTMKSKHLEGLAVDLYFTKDGKLLSEKEPDRQHLIRIALQWSRMDPSCRSLGLELDWDWPHFELK